MRGRDFGLQRDDVCGGRGPVALVLAVDQREHPRDVLRVFVEDRRVLRVAVVRLVGQPEAGLAQVQQIAGRVLRVGVDVHAGGTADAGALQFAEFGGQLGRRQRGVDAGQLVEQRADAELGDGIGVHEAGVEVADALWVGALGALRRGGLGDDVAHLLFGAVGQQPESAIGGAVGRDRVVGQPATVDMAEQVVLRAGTGIDMAQVDARADSFYGHAHHCCLTKVRSIAGLALAAARHRRSRR